MKANMVHPLNHGKKKTSAKLSFSPLNARQWRSKKAQTLDFLHNFVNSPRRFQCHQEASEVLQTVSHCQNSSISSSRQFQAHARSYRYLSSINTCPRRSFPSLCYALQLGIEPSKTHHGLEFNLSCGT